MDRDQTAEDYFLFETDENMYSDIFFNAYKRQLCANVTLVCKNEEIIKANSFVLAAHSPLLERLLNSTGEQSIFFLDIDKSDLELLLQYIYRGSVQVPKRLADGFLNIAKKLNVISVDKYTINSENSVEKSTENNTSDTMSPSLLSEHQNNSNIPCTNTQSKGIQPIVTSSGDSEEDIVVGCKKKVKNPFAKSKRKNSDRSDSDSTWFSCSANVAGPSKPKKIIDVSVASLNNDSDIEIIDNVPPIFSVLDRTEEVRSTGSRTRSVSSGTRKIFKTNQKGSKKLKKLTPIETLMELPLNKLKNFCALCCKWEKDIQSEIRKVHALPQRRKQFVCQVCCKKFFFEKFLEIHKCDRKPQ